MQKLITDPEAREFLVRVGESLKLEDEVRADMKASDPSKLYCESADGTCEQARTSWVAQTEEDVNSMYKGRIKITYCQLHYKTS